MVDDALARLFEEHHPALLRIACIIIQDEDLAQDACQETYLKSLEEPRLQQAGFNAGAWLRDEVSRVSQNMVRTHASVPLSPCIEAPSLTPLEHLLHAEWKILFHEAVGRLPKPQRQVITLLYFWGKPRQEVAQMLGMEPSLVAAYVAHAHEQLARDLASL